MTKTTMMISAAAIALSAGTATAGTWVAAHPVQNSATFSLFGINDQNDVTGDYTDASGVQHGFVGPFDGSNYTSFDDPDGTTQPRALNNSDTTVGFDTGSLVPWERTADGTLTTITKKGVAMNQLAQGINTKGKFTGNSLTGKGKSFGYRGKNAHWKFIIKLPIANAGYAGRAINDAGDMAGWYYDPTTGLQRGWVMIGGTATSVDFPGANYTVGEGLNDSGIMSGQFQDPSGNIHGFLYDTSTQEFTQLDAPGSTLTQVWGINNNGIVAVSTTDVGSFAYCMTDTGCPKDAGTVTHVPGKKAVP